MVGLDGRFVLPKGSKDKIQLQPLPGQWAKSNYGSFYKELNQIYIGEPMVNSLISVMVENYKFPITISNKTLTSELMNLGFPDVTSMYGKDSNYSFVIDLKLNNSASSFPVHIDTFHGI